MMLALGERGTRARREADTPEARAALKRDVARVQRRLLGTDGADRLELALLREQSAARKAQEEAHLRARVASVADELEAERRARRSAEVRVRQLERQVAELEEHRAKHVRGRLAAEEAARRQENGRARVAANKRELEERFARLLRAYQELAGGYETLKERFLRLKAAKEQSSVDKVKSSLRRVRELFTQEEEQDPDRLPGFSGQQTAAGTAAVPGAPCDFCGDDGLCKGFRAAPLDATFCTCGHERAMHDDSAHKP